MAGLDHLSNLNSSVISLQSLKDWDAHQSHLEFNLETCFRQSRSWGSTGLRPKVQRFVSQNVPNLDERCAAEEEPEHVGHDVIADHTGDGDNEPAGDKGQTIGKCQHHTRAR